MRKQGDRHKQIVFSTQDQSLQFLCCFNVQCAPILWVLSVQETTRCNVQQTSWTLGHEVSI